MLSNILSLMIAKYKAKYEIRDIPVPTPGENDLLVKVGAAGFCHTELVSIIRLRWPSDTADGVCSYQVWEGVYESQTPLVPSHEPVGTIVSMGAHARKTGKWRIGDRIGVIMFRHACHDCIGCKTTKDVRFCKNKEAAGLTHDGGMAEYMIGDADECVHLPDGLTFEQAAPLMCAGVSGRFTTASNLSNAKAHRQLHGPVLWRRV